MATRRRRARTNYSSEKREAAVIDLRQKLELAAPPPAPEFRHIAVADLLAPDLPARTSMDPAALEELKLSIQQVGIIEPLVVSPEGDKYRVLAGNRRLLAARDLDLNEVPCVLRTDTDISPRAITAHENAFREDLNPAEEALYLKQLLELDCGGDTIHLAALVRRPLRHVEQRLRLLLGDAEVFQALVAGAIGPGVAEELNKVQDRSRRVMYLECAVKGGARLDMVRDWRVKGNLQDALLAQAEAPVIQGAAPRMNVAEPMRCTLCGSAEDAYEMQMLFVHRGCARYVERQRLAAEAAADPAANGEAPLAAPTG